MKVGGDEWYYLTVEIWVNLNCCNDEWKKSSKFETGSIFGNNQELIQINSIKPARYSTPSSTILQRACNISQRGFVMCCSGQMVIAVGIKSDAKRNFAKGQVPVTFGG